ncbi:uncharacterized protein LOC113205493 [Frankliniella occidentalis]|uniref:Uncharacterized protein LOC113205493 n=1 Tax=Frankliniella occidentalis TaxID=133901 RepID=A0A6J1S8G2_FRAOC|nr:uncharacterized protein LOC113205493 [Frankliniella occidentalis]
MTQWTLWLAMALVAFGTSGATKLRAEAGQVGVEGVVDNILGMMHRELERVGLGTAELPDVAGTENGLTLEATEGMMKGLFSLGRSGAAVVDHAADHVVLNTTLNLSTLEMSYKVHAKYLFFSLTSDVGATIDKNSITLSVGMDYSSPACLFGVQSVSVDVLDGIQWKTTGFNTINKLVSTVLNILVPPAKVKGWINDALNQAINDFKVPCLSLIPGIGNGTYRC